MGIDGKGKKPPSFSLKDQLFNQERVEFLAGLFYKADPKFDAAGFVHQVMKTLKKLELKERIVHIAETLELFLPEDFKVAVARIKQALPPPLDPTRTDDDFGDFIFAPLGEFVVRKGLSKQYLRTSLKILKEITQRFSMEDAIRFFINQYPEETLAELAKWSTDKNYHVRRLVSEGTRPMLPWSKRLSIDVATPVRLLDILHTDPTRYVTRSVANHLNDIAKTMPELVLNTLKKWRKEKRQEKTELEWITRHSLRTLVKQGNPKALRLLGCRPSPRIVVRNLQMKSNAVRPGDTLEFFFSVSASRDELLMIDYVIDFVKSNGSLAPKVHKLKQIQLKKNETKDISKRHKLHSAATTYTLYPGTHRLTLQINGQSYGTLEFELGDD